MLGIKKKFKAVDVAIKSKLLATKLMSKLHRLRNEYMRYDMNVLETIADRIYQKELIQNGYLNRISKYDDIEEKNARKRLARRGMK